MAIKDPRPLHIKIRLAARKGMIKSQEDLIGIMQDIIESRVVPEGVVIHWIDWKKGKGGTANEGRITRDIANAIEDFWWSIVHEDSQVEIKKLASARRKSGPKARGKPAGPEGGH